MCGLHFCLLSTAFLSSAMKGGVIHGFGAVFSNSWCYGRWPASWLHCNIAILEFFPIVLS